ncbi:DUF6542 domain-containing protein [Blastococcus sp. VKM Ac-2987]|uniref:DUF6542 domain-containing protein n=1 Tax=Blastococcus sp. VKM Ac-2987 TaxID=3004141 RepID=UPI0022AB5AEF|nr:DUF6542 domain-containing protein [Blastococcus sp. VKM Ac-2987]MCZ2858025.1 hypothetical protein [Blastococcus sp. VKM Ac-2987]
MPAPGRAGERLRAAEREHGYDRYAQPPAPGARRHDSAPGRPAARHDSAPGARRHDSAPGRPAARAAQERARGGTAAPAATRESKLRGSLAVLGMFLLTLAGCAVDSFVGMGLGMITLVALSASTAAAALLVRRRDLLSVIVAPPLVFVLVAVVNISLAPSATLNLPTMATLLVRGFPTMAVATAIAVVLTLVRLVTRR